MKKIFSVALMIASLLSLALPAAGKPGDPTDKTVRLKKQRKEHQKGYTPEGVRMPSRAIEGHIHRA